MNRVGLTGLMTAEGVGAESYVVDGSVRDECLCLVPVEGGWSVFYSERGRRTGEHFYETEAEACDAMASSLLADSGNRIRRDE